MGMNRSVLVVGAGFFGMYIADYLASQGHHVVLCDKEHDFMQRASYVNQARVHNGYHYPRSILTARRSRLSFPRFCDEFRECIDDTFENYYAVGKLLSKVTASQFNKFCERIDAYCEPAPYKITKLTNPNYVEQVFSSIEHTFDSVKLKEIMKARLELRNIEIRMGTVALSVAKDEKGVAVVLGDVNGLGNNEKRVFDHVFNCTYSMINKLLTNSKIDRIHLKHELTEICLVDVPDEIKGVGITVMCGPFFSTMPFPSRGLHSFSHVRYTPHCEWYDLPDKNYTDPHDIYNSSKRKTSWRAMLNDAKRYFPILEESCYKESLWEVKTVLPRSEVDDSRPILFKSNYSIKGFHCVMGGKIDNVYDAIHMIQMLGLEK